MTCSWLVLQMRLVMVGQYGCTSSARVNGPLLVVDHKQLVKLFGQCCQSGQTCLGKLIQLCVEAIAV